MGTTDLLPHHSEMLVCCSLWFVILVSIVTIHVEFVLCKIWRWFVRSKSKSDFLNKDVFCLSWWTSLNKCSNFHYVWAANTVKLTNFIPLKWTRQPAQLQNKEESILPCICKQTFSFYRYNLHILGKNSAVFFLENLKNSKITLNTLITPVFTLHFAKKSYFSFPQGHFIRFLYSIKDMLEIINESAVFCVIMSLTIELHPSPLIYFSLASGLKWAFIF